MSCPGYVYCLVIRTNWDLILFLLYYIHCPGAKCVEDQKNPQPKVNPPKNVDLMKMNLLCPPQFQKTLKCIQICSGEGPFCERVQIASAVKLLQLLGNGEGKGASSLSTSRPCQGRGGIC